MIELRSRSDGLAELQDEMREYVASGAQLGWLIDPQSRSVHVHRPGAPGRARQGGARGGGGKQVAAGSLGDRGESY